MRDDGYTRELKFVEDKWFVFERTHDASGTAELAVNHWCAGRQKDPVTGRTYSDAEMRDSLRRGYKPTIWELIPECQACGEDVPEDIVMMVKLRNSNL